MELYCAFGKLHLVAEHKHGVVDSLQIPQNVCQRTRTYK